MICASCGEPTAPDDACSACGEPPLLGGRWRLEAEIGHGAAGTVFRACEVGTGRVVAAKEVPLSRHAASRAAGVCAREAEVLRQLDHPGIPRLVDAQVFGSALWVFQELVAGESLQGTLATHRYTEDEVLGIVEGLLGILVYLHGLSPPVIHRDIKPANVLVRPDGRLALVDFGSVRDRIAADGAATTNAGTFGYMAPEQLRGAAGLGSDIYAVGAVAVALLSRQDPAALLGWDQQLAWRSHVRVRPATARLLTAMLTADPARRPADAARLLETVRAARAGPAPARRWVAPLALVALVGVVGLGIGEAAREVRAARGGRADDAELAPPAPVPSTAPVPSPAPAPPPAFAPTEPPTPAPTDPPTPAPTAPEASVPPVPTGPLPSTLETDAATGAVHPVKSERAAVQCAYEMLGGLLTAEQSYEAAFDKYDDDFVELGWQPDRECRWYVTSAVQRVGENSFVLHAVVTRGSGLGRQLTLRPTGDVHEGRRLTAAEVKTVVSSGSRWPGTLRD